MSLIALPTSDYALAMTPADDELLVAQYRQISDGRYLFNGRVDVGDPATLELDCAGEFYHQHVQANPPADTAPFAWLSALEYAPDGQWLATGRWNPVDGSAIQVASPVGLWRREGAALRPAGFLNWHTIEVTGLSFACLPDGTMLLVSSSLDGTVALWRWSGREWLPRRRLEVHNRHWLSADDQSARKAPTREERSRRGVLGCGLSPDGAWLALALANGALELWPTSSFDREPPDQPTQAQEPRTLSRAPARMIHCEFLSDGRLISADGSGQVRFWDPDAGRLLRTLEAGSVITHARAARGSTYATVVAATADDHVWVWDAATPNLAGFAADPAGAVARARAER